MDTPDKKLKNYDTKVKKRLYNDSKEKLLYKNAKD